MRLIDADALLKTVPFTRRGGDLTEYTEGYLDCAVDARVAIDDAPTVEAEPVRHGRWNVHEMLEGDDAHCSECGFFLSVSDIFDDYPRLESLHYCPSCGAKMDLKEGEQ